jgi:hypothetical protein
MRGCERECPRDTGRHGCGAMRIGQAWQVALAMAQSGTAGPTRQVRVRCVEVGRAVKARSRLGRVGHGRRGLVRSGPAWPGPVRCGVFRRGRQGLAGPGRARLGCPGEVRPVLARRGGSWHGRSGVAWCVEIGLAGKSWFGLAWHGKAGWVGQGHACRAVKARSAWVGLVGAGWVRLGRVWPGRSGAVGHGRSGPGMAGRLWQVRAWHGRAALASRDMVCPTRGEKCECPRNTGRHGAAARRRPSRQVWVGRGRGGKACSGPVRRGRPGVTWSGQGVARSGRHGPVRYVLTRPGRRGVARHDRARSGAADRVCHGGARPDQATRFSPVRPAGLV